MIYFIGKVLHLLYRLKHKAESILNTYMFQSFVLAGNNVKFLSTSKVFNINGNRDSIIIGENTVIRGELLTFKHGGTIEIGKFCYIGENTRIWSAAKVTIGDRVLISHNVNIHDNNAHPLNTSQRHEQFKLISLVGHPKDFFLNEKPIVIEDDVWIGFNSTIIKGITIGTGSIVAANSVVIQNVPPNVTVAGNPAKIIRNN